MKIYSIVMTLPTVITGNEGTKQLFCLKDAQMIIGKCVSTVQFVFLVIWQVLIRNSPSGSLIFMIKMIDKEWRRR